MIEVSEQHHSDDGQDRIVFDCLTLYIINRCFCKSPINFLVIYLACVMHIALAYACYACVCMYL